MGNLTNIIKDEKKEVKQKTTTKSTKLKVNTPKTITKKSIKTPQKTNKTTDIEHDKLNKGNIFMFFGEEGTGKTYASLQLARKYGKTLLLDTENKAAEVLNTKFADLKCDSFVPIIDDGKKLSQVFKKDSDIHSIILQKINTTTGKRDAVETVKFIKEITPKILHFIKSGNYNTLIIDSVLPIWDYSKEEWLKRNKGRKRPSKFEWGEIEDIRQDILFPFINYCKIYSVHLIMTASISGHYVNDVMIGYKQDAKAWLLQTLTYELWFSRDYKKYVIKHPYKPYWEIQDEDLNISDYLFDYDFIDNQAIFKNFEDFKYETMTSEQERRTKKEESKKGLIIGGGGK